MMNIPEWVDYCSAVALHRKRVVIVGGWNDGIDNKRALLLDITDNTKVTQLADLPEPRYSTSVVLSDNDVYVVGGYSNNSDYLSSVYYLSLGSDAWQTKKSMPHKVYSPLVIQYHQCIYALLGYNTCCQSSVSQYNIEDDSWKQCSDMLLSCSNEEAGVVVHEDRIKVFTVDKCLMYADDTYTWTVKQNNKLGDAVNAFVRGGQICAVVQNGGTYSVMSYDDVKNVWKTEHEMVDSAWSTELFC